MCLGHPGNEITHAWGCEDRVIDMVASHAP